jgi:hypothetical protein
MEQIMFQKYLSFLLLAIWRWNPDWGILQEKLDIFERE